MYISYITPANPDTEPPKQGPTTPTQEPPIQEPEIDDTVDVNIIVCQKYRSGKIKHTNQ